MTAALARIGIVEDDTALRAYLESIVSGYPEFALGFSAGSVADALAALDRHPVDLCLVDLNLPDGRGVEVIRALKDRGDSKALVLSMLGDRITVMDALSAGADGYILKSGRPAVLISEIRETLQGLAPVSPQIAAYLLDLVRPTPASTNDKILTPREIEILDLFARGLSYRETAELLGIALNTVSDHVRKIYAKLSNH